MELNVALKFEDPASSTQIRGLCQHFRNSRQLTKYVKNVLDSGVHNFSCLKCGQQWAWQEVRSLALLSEGEWKQHEEQVAQLTKDDTESYKKCPGCSLLVQRLDAENLCVECPACCKRSGAPYRFCWSCMRKWTGQSPQGGSCKHKSCSTVALLLSCPVINNSALTVDGCPVVRACPDCKTLISHAGGCKFVHCKNCNNRFCYRCLENFSACYNAKPEWYHFALCAKPMAVRQTFSSR
ncbi:E3 ubiquitin-protein ligase DDB_G0292642-like isoform X2 [Heterodontus francisci]|uniref:E3 ubiquitin-protein ligase DDB_G0292642-like isoform X2 n=1 Tax=Heterodontus francisci TaxID=7792 RepID=UPI00355B8B2B